MKLNHYLAIALAFASSSAVGQNISVADNYLERLEKARSVGPVDNESPFGETISKSNGSFEFRVPVLSIPGNGGMDINVTYRLRMMQDQYSLWLFEEDKPYISGTFSASGGWTLGGGAETNRCSVPAFPKSIRPDNGRPDWFTPDEFWNGYEMNIPGTGRSSINMLGSLMPSWGPSTGGPYPWATNENWFLSCIPLIVGTGEGFLAHSPTGLKYYFNEMSGYREIISLDKLAWTGQDIDLARNEVRIYASRVEDRFGNYIQDLAASDGRVVTRSVSGSTITYSYGGRQWVVNTAHPFSVTYPDGSQWKATSSQVITGPSPSQVSCQLGSPSGEMTAPTGPGQTITVQNPSGATGVFTFKSVALGYSGVVPACYAVDNFSAAPYFLHQVVVPGALTNRVISGPGLTTSSLAITYGPPNGCVSSGSGPQCTGASPTTRTVTYNYSSGQYVIYTFGNKFLETADLLLKTEEGSASAGIVRTTTQEYALLPMVGVLHVSGMSSTYSPSSNYRVVQRSKNIKQDGTNYYWRVKSSCGTSGTDLCFDEMGRPTQVERGSSLSP